MYLFINGHVATILPRVGQHFGSHDRTVYNRIRIVTRRIIVRANCYCLFARIDIWASSYTCLNFQTKLQRDYVR